MEKTVFTIFVNDKKYLTIRTTEERIKAKALRMYYRERAASNIKVTNKNNQVIFAV